MGEWALLRGGVRAFFRARPALLPAASAGFGDQFEKLIPSVRLRRTLDRKLCKEACVAMSVGWWDACCFRQLSGRQAGVRAMKKRDSRQPEQAPSDVSPAISGSLREPGPAAAGPPGRRYGGFPAYPLSSVGLPLPSLDAAERWIRSSKQKCTQPLLKGTASAVQDATAS